MKFNLKKCGALLLSSLLLVLSACSTSSTDDNVVDVAMGRYMEDAWTLPENTESVWPIVQMADGSLLFFITTVAEGTDEDGGKIYDMGAYTTADGISWQKQETPWLDALRERGGYINAADCAPDGTLYLVYYDPELDYTVGKVGGDGALVHIDADWSAGPGSDIVHVEFDNPLAGSGSDVSGGGDAGLPVDMEAGADGDTAGGAEPEDEYVMQFYPDDIQVGDDGDLYFGSQYEGAKRFSAQGEFKQQYGEDGGPIFALQGDRLVQVEYPWNGEGSSSISLYNRDSGFLDSQMDAGVLSGKRNDALTSGEDGALYLANENGLHRLVEGGSTWELLIDGAISSLGIPSLPVTGLYHHGDDEFLMLCGDYSVGYSLLNYRYSADTPSRPGTELTIFSLYPSDTLKQAAGEFRRKNPDVLVTIQTPLEDDSAVTASEAIRALNTQLLAGDGPDILMLDSLPLRSYMEKGVLADMSEWAAPLIDSALYENIAGSLAGDDGKLYAVPARFNFHSLWAGTPEDIQQGRSLESMLQYARSNPDLRLFYAMKPRELFAQLYPMCAPTFTDADGNIDADGFAAFLQLVTDFSDTAGGVVLDDEKESSGNYLYEIDNWLSASDFRGVTYMANDYIVYNNVVLSGFQSALMPNGAVSKRNNVVIWGGPDGVVETSVSDELITQLVDIFPGQAENVFFPGTILGVNAAGTQQELARAFVETVLSQSVQYADLGDGFPVNKAAFQQSITKENSLYISTSSQNDDGLEMSVEAGWPSPGVFRHLETLTKELKTPYLANTALTELIESEVQIYFNGDSTARETADAVAQRARLYLNQ